MTRPRIEPAIAELTALHEAARLISAMEHQPANIVFLTDCRSAIQSLQSPSDQLERDTQRLLGSLSQHAQVAVQWIPAHCGLAGNEQADSLAKAGSRLEQPKQAASYREAKTLVKRIYKQQFDQTHPRSSEEQMPQMQRQQETMIFRLRTGHCRLRAHMYRLGLSHSPDCPCETAPQTPEHILQECPLHQNARNQQWPSGATMAEKLWGTKEDLSKTTDFIASLKLEI